MSRWLDLAAQLEATPEGAANSVTSADSRPNGPNCTICTAPLPPDLLDGLALLEAMPCPRISDPGVWQEIVGDARRLASEGWAQQALGLGWSPLALWGCSPDPGGNPDHDGLAVVLAGQRVVLLDSAVAIIETGERSRALFHRRPMPGAVLLWELGVKHGV